MRIISQNGTIDMPYDMCCVWRQEEVIYCRAIGSDDNVMMATYSSEDKAEKVVEMLRVAYAGKFITNADIPENFDETIKTAMKCGFGTVIVKDSCSRVEFNNLNGYFHFPAEEELEKNWSSLWKNI